MLDYARAGQWSWRRRGGAPALAVLALFLPSIARAGDLPEPARVERPRAPAASELPVRAVWVTRWDYQTETDVRAIVRGCAALGFNRIIFQVRGQADAFYRSSLEPWGESLEGASNGQPGFDPLEAAIAEARAAGVELHAWVNLLPAWKGKAAPRDRRHLVHAHPDWFLMDQSGRRRILDAEHYALLNPCLPQVRRHLAAVVGEIAARYPVQGIQLDYVRFLDRNIAKGEDVPYDPGTVQAFRKASGRTPREDPAAWDQFRWRAMNELVAGIAASVRERRPACRLSLAAIRDIDHARRRLFQDAPGWLRKGWLDEVYPMIYERELERFSSNVRRWTGACGADRVIVGVGAHLLPAVSEAQEELRRLAAEGAGGYCLFSYAELFASRSPYAPTGPATAQHRAQLRALFSALHGVARAEEPAAAPKAAVRGKSE